MVTVLKAGDKEEVDVDVAGDGIHNDWKLLLVVVVMMIVIFDDAGDDCVEGQW